jgi:hypothetical protein
MAMMCKSGAKKELAVETATRNGDCQIFFLIFQWDFISTFLNYWA